MPLNRPRHGFSRSSHNLFWWRNTYQSPKYWPRRFAVLTPLPVKMGSVPAGPCVGRIPQLGSCSGTVILCRWRHRVTEIARDWAYAEEFITEDEILLDARE